MAGELAYHAHDGRSHNPLIIRIRLIDWIIVHPNKLLIMDWGKSNVANYYSTQFNLCVVGIVCVM